MKQSETPRRVQIFFLTVSPSVFTSSENFSDMAFPASSAAMFPVMPSWHRRGEKSFSVPLLKSARHPSMPFLSSVIEAGRSLARMSAPCANAMIFPRYDASAPAMAMPAISSMQVDRKREERTSRYLSRVGCAVLWYITLASAVSTASLDVFSSFVFSAAALTSSQTFASVVRKLVSTCSSSNRLSICSYPYFGDSTLMKYPFDCTFLTVRTALLPSLMPSIMREMAPYPPAVIQLILWMSLLTQMATASKTVFLRRSSSAAFLEKSRYAFRMEKAGLPLSSTSSASLMQSPSYTYLRRSSVQMPLSSSSLSTVPTFSRLEYIGMASRLRLPSSSRIS